MEPQDQLPPSRTIVVWTGLFEGGLAILAIVLGWLLDAPPARSVQWTASAAGLGAAASLPPLAIALLCIRIPLRPFAELLRIVDELLAPLFRGCRAWELALIAILAGFGEEMLFRGIVQLKLAQWIGEPHGVWIALAGASVLFGLLHLITPTYAVLAGLIGLYLGWLWLATGNLLVPITTHAVYDFLALLYVVRVRRFSRRNASPQA